MTASRDTIVIETEKTLRENIEKAALRVIAKKRKIRSKRKRQNEGKKPSKGVLKRQDDRQKRLREMTAQCL